MRRFSSSEEGERANGRQFATPVPAVTVYCGASPVAHPEFLRLAETVGHGLARQGWRLVYGGGSLGLMGHCAEGALAIGGTVTGITTLGLTAVEPAHPGLTQLEIVQTMHQRKLRMTELGDAFLVLPGGFGTLDETFEALTWRQLGIHEKPIVCLNYRGYFDPLLAFAGQAVELGFIQPAHLSLLHVAPTVEDAFASLSALLPVPARVTTIRTRRRTTLVVQSSDPRRPEANPGSAAG